MQPNNTPVRWKYVVVTEPIRLSLRGRASKARKSKSGSVLIGTTVLEELASSSSFYSRLTASNFKAKQLFLEPLRSDVRARHVRRNALLASRDISLFRQGLMVLRCFGIIRSSETALVHGLRWDRGHKISEKICNALERFGLLRNWT